MKNNALIILIAVLIILGIGFCTYMIIDSSDKNVPSVEEGTTLTVTGQGSITAVPDMVTVNIGVTTTSDSVATAQTENSATTNQVLAALKGMNIEDKDITTVSYYIYPQYSYDSTVPVIYGYEVSNSLLVTLHDIDKVGELLEKATTAGANTAGSITFGSSEADKLYSQALTQACEAAKVKGEALADASGMKIKGLVSLSEGGSYSSAYEVPSPLYADSAAAGVPIESGQLTFTAIVTAVYTIK